MEKLTTFVGPWIVVIHEAPSCYVKALNRDPNCPPEEAKWQVNAESVDQAKHKVAEHFGVEPEWVVSDK